MAEHKPNISVIYAPLQIATAVAARQSFASASRVEHLAAGASYNPEDPNNFYFTCDLVHEGRNGNGDVFLRNEMEAAWHTLIGQPIDKDHILTVDGSVGQITDASYDVVDDLALIRIAAYINTTYYADVAWKVAAGIVCGVSMECAFEFGDQRQTSRILYGIQFVGAGLTRMPADQKSQVNNMGTDVLTVSSRRRFLLLQAAVEAAFVPLAA